MLFADEVKIHLYAFAAIRICMEVFLLIRQDIHALQRDVFALTAIAFFCFFCVLEHILKHFVHSNAASFFSLIPAALLFLLLRSNEILPYLDAAPITAAAVRLLFVFMPKRETLLQYGVFLLDAAAAVLYFSKHVLGGSFLTDKLLFISLVILTLSALQKLLFEKNKDAFPFYYFMLLSLVLLTLPMGKKPIDWTPVATAAQNLVSKVLDVTDRFSYYMSSFSDNGSYTAGYSSLAARGETLKQTNKTELILRTREKPYFIYKDEKTGETMKMRRTVYLTGGRGVDRQNLIRFLTFLHAAGIDKAHAGLFTQISQITLEYAYLATADEIVPSGSFLLFDEDRKIDSGVSSYRHKKGYKIEARYLDIDYGSPYLTELFREAGSMTPKEAFSYTDACAYVKELFGIDFDKIMSGKEYDNCAEEDLKTSYLDADGASSRMADLAYDITSGAQNDYDKCRLIEAFLRQYTYSLNAVGGHDPASDISTPEGMADIADRFLFETKTGYCVHFTASMVMLLRLAGIPARTSMGYRCAFPFEEKDSYEISSTDAHAWPEAYLANIGWVPFEPTAAYRTAAEFTWHRKAPAEEPAAHADPSVGVPSPPAHTEPEKEEVSSAPLASRVFKIALPVFLSTALLIAALIFGSTVIMKLRYRYGTPEKKLKMDVEMIKKNIRQRSPERFTDRGLLSGYTDRAPEELRPDIQKVFNVYYRIVYGNESSPGVSAEENAFAQNLREELLKKNTPLSGSSYNYPHPSNGSEPS